MFFRLIPFALVVCVIPLLFACAAPKAPTGGPKDETPPMVVEGESTPNYQTNFVPEEIIITFDEWFNLKDAQSQVVISPLMPENPEIKQKNKTIVITVPDSLSEETTYTINFGNAIADLNEGNILENYSFVFSTGSVLDSAKLSGKVINAETLQPAEGVWVMLYPFGEDSAVYKRRPDYVAKTNKEGIWSMANIRSDTFAIVALKDENLNFLYDQDTEWFGWLDESLITAQPITILRDISVFAKESKPGIRDILHTAPGWIKIVANDAVGKPVPEMIPVIDSFATAWDADTLHIWYNPQANYAGKAIIGSDTTSIRTSSQSPLWKEPIKIIPQSGRVHPQGKVAFKARIPVLDIDTSRIIIEVDSIGRLPFTSVADTIDNRFFEVKARWEPNARNTLTFLPGAIADFWGRDNDTIRHSIVVLGADQFGELTLQVEGLDSTKNYVLILRSGNQVEATFLIDQQKTATLKRDKLIPGKYGVELIEDLNRNRVWDAGSYEVRRQPERKMLFTIDNVRAAWEVESKITWQ
jgi:hypothetical protein